MFGVYPAWVVFSQHVWCVPSMCGVCPACVVCTSMCGAQYAWCVQHVWCQACVMCPACVVHSMCGASIMCGAQHVWCVQHVLCPACVVCPACVACVQYLWRVSSMCGVCTACVVCPACCHIKHSTISPGIISWARGSVPFFHRLLGLPSCTRLTLNVSYKTSLW